MTAQLSCHVQKFVVIKSLEFGWEQNEIYYIWNVMETLLVNWVPGYNMISYNKDMAYIILHALWPERSFVAGSVNKILHTSLLAVDVWCIGGDDNS